MRPAAVTSLPTCLPPTAAALQRQGWMTCVPSLLLVGAVRAVVQSCDLRSVECTAPTETGGAPRGRRPVQARADSLPRRVGALLSGELFRATSARASRGQLRHLSISSYVLAPELHHLPAADSCARSKSSSHGPAPQPAGSTTSMTPSSASGLWLCPSTISDFLLLAQMPQPCLTR